MIALILCSFPRASAGALAKQIWNLSGAAK